MNQTKLHNLFVERNPQRDQCYITLVGDMVTLFLSVFGGDREDWTHVEEYEWKGQKNLDITGSMREDFHKWDEWITKNNITCHMTQEYSDQDYDFHLTETFVNGVYCGDEWDVTCHSEEEEPLRLLEECK